VVSPARSTIPSTQLQLSHVIDTLAIVSAHCSHAVRTFTASPHKRKRKTCTSLSLLGHARNLDMSRKWPLSIKLCRRSTIIAEVDVRQSRTRAYHSRRKIS
jgi:hypothetical protein